MKNYPHIPDSVIKMVEEQPNTNRQEKDEIL